MIDYVGRSVDTLEGMGRWDNYFAQQDRNAQQRWMDREARARYEEANQRNAAVSAQRRQQLAENAGLLRPLDGPFAGPRQPLEQLQPTSAPAAAPSNSTAADSARFMDIWNRRRPLVGANSPDFDVRRITPANYAQLNPGQREAWEEFARLYGRRSSVRIPNVLGIRADQQVGSDEEVAAARQRMRDVGLDLRDGQLVFNVGNYSTEALRFPTETRTPSARTPSTTSPVAAASSLSNADVGQVLSNARLTGPRAGIRTPEDTASLRREGYSAQLGGAHEHGQAWDLERSDGQPWDEASMDATIAEFEQNTGRRVNRARSYHDQQRGHFHLTWSGDGQRSGGTQIASRLEDDDYYQRVANVTAGMVPTREMEIALRNSEDLYERAQLLAQHGDLAGSDAATTSAMAQYMAYITGGRMAAFRAASGGNNQAAEWLISEFYGYPEDAVRVRSTGERAPRLSVEINGQRASSVPVSRNDLMNSLYTLIDREGALENQRLAQQLIENVNDNTTRFQIAQLESTDRRLALIAGAENARMDAAVRQAIAMGRAYTVTDTENGGTWVLYMNGFDEQGAPVWNMGNLSMQEQRVPGTNNETADVPTFRSVTGIPGVEAQ